MKMQKMIAHKIKENEISCKTESRNKKKPTERYLKEISSGNGILISKST